MSEVVLKREVIKDSPSSMICSRSGAVKASRATGARASFGAMVEMGRGGNGRKWRKEIMERGREGKKGC